MRDDIKWMMELDASFMIRTFFAAEAQINTELKAYKVEQSKSI